MIQATGRTVYRPYPSKLKRQTIFRCRDRTVHSPQLFNYPKGWSVWGLQPSTSTTHFDSVTWSAVFISRLSIEMRYDVAIIWPVNLEDDRCYELCLPRGDMRFDKI